MQWSRATSPRIDLALSQEIQLEFADDLGLDPLPLRIFEEQRILGTLHHARHHARAAANTALVVGELHFALFFEVAAAFEWRAAGTDPASQTSRRSGSSTTTVVPLSFPGEWMRICPP